MHALQEATGDILCQLWGMTELLNGLETTCVNLVCQLGALCSKETRKATVLQGESRVPERSSRKVPLVK